MKTDNVVFEYETQGGVSVRRERFATPYVDAVKSYIDRLDTRRGAVFSSNYEYPGRYTRWDTAMIDPPLGVSSKGRAVTIEAYNERGEILLEAICDVLKSHEHVAEFSQKKTVAHLQVKEPTGVVEEEMRSRAPTVFSVLRAIVDLFRSDADPNLALYGAFGYDLCFQFDAIELTQKRADDQRDMVMFLPDEILIVDHHAAQAWHERYMNLQWVENRQWGWKGTVRMCLLFRPDLTPGAAIINRGSMRDWLKKPRKNLSKGTCLKWFQARCLPSAVSIFLPRFHIS